MKTYYSITYSEGWVERFIISTTVEDKFLRSAHFEANEQWDAGYMIDHGKFAIPRGHNAEEYEHYFHIQRRKGLIKSFGSCVKFSDHVSTSI